jgi:lysyl-tRNA synthetase class 2
MTWQPNKLEAERLEKLQRLRERGIDPFPGSVQRTHTIAQAVSAFLEQEAQGDAAQPIEVAVCGRLRAIRSSGKVSFAHVEDGTGKVQLFIRQDNVGEATYELFKRDLDLFDFVQADGVR